MHGFGSHTYSLINARNERFWVKFHFKTMQGIANLTDPESAELIGRDRENHQRDLYESIARGDSPKWRVMVQVMPERDAEKTPYNPFDLTKVWPHGDCPLIEVGVMELNRNPENYFAEVEQSAFSPANVVPGISHSPDKMLQFRIVSYADAHRYRLGVNYESLPVNRPRCPVATYHRDGNDDYTQAGNLYRLLPAAEQQRLHQAIANAMQGVPREIVERQLGHFAKADPAYAEGVRKALVQR